MRSPDVLLVLRLSVEADKSGKKKEIAIGVVQNNIYFFASGICTLLIHILFMKDLFAY